jgi:3-deoxy-D-arabino-heptulosonate 7-phosphate (DAHP) synthase class II
MPVVRIARMGGQYAKPRSKPTEIVNGQEINSFRYVLLFFLESVESFSVSSHDLNICLLVGF